MTENEKDWRNPVVRQIYFVLACADSNGSDVVNWLNRNGFCNLTVCPECHVDDFVHVENCVLGELLHSAEAEHMGLSLDQLHDKILDSANAKSPEPSSTAEKSVDDKTNSNKTEVD